jgi:hypothetical protein
MMRRVRNTSASVRTVLNLTLLSELCGKVPTHCQLTISTVSMDYLRTLISAVSSIWSPSTDLDLLFLIEGSQQFFHISLPHISTITGKPMTVNDLRQTIFDHKCQDLAPDPFSLTLLKVRILVIVLFLLSD